MSKKGVITITVEELEIIVSAKIEQVKPQIQKLVKEIKEAVKNTDGIGSEVLGKIDTAKIAKEMTKVKKQVKDMFDPQKTSFIDIEGYSKEIRNLTGNIDINALKNKVKSVGDVFEGFTSMKDAGNTGNLYEKILNSFQKIGGISKKKYTFNKEATYIANNPQLENGERKQERINKQISEADKKYQLLIKTIKKHNTLLEESKNKTAKLKEQASQNTKQGQKLSGIIKQIGSFLSGAGKNANKLRTGLDGAKNIANKVKGHLKVGLGQIMKIAGSLIGLRAIYSGLQSVANSWLSSQNAQAKQLSTNIEYMKFALGSALKPVIETIVNLIYQALKGVQSLIYALTGVNIFANASAKAYTSMANSAKNAQKATQALADIDEIHNIQENSDSGSSGGSGAPNFDLATINPMPDFLSKLMDNIKNGNWYEIGASIGDKINETLEKIPWEKIKEKAGNCGKNLAEFINGGVHKTDWKLVGGTLAEGVNTAFSFLGNFLKTADFYSYGKAVSDAINGFFEKVEWDKVGQTLSDGLKDVIDFSLGLIENFDINKFYSAIWKLISNIDWFGILKKLGEIILKGVKASPIFSIPGLIVQVFELAVNKIIDMLNTLNIQIPDWVPGIGGQSFGFDIEHVNWTENYNKAVDEMLGITQKGIDENNKIIEKGTNKTNTTVNTQLGITKKSFGQALSFIKNDTSQKLAETNVDTNSKAVFFKNILSEAFEKAKENANISTNQIKENTETNFSNLNNSSIFTKLKEKVRTTFDQSNNSKKWGSDTTSNYNNGLNSQQSPFRTIINSVKSKLYSLNQSNYSNNWGKSTISNYNNGLNSQQSTTKSIIGRLKDKIKNDLQKSDSYTWGKDMLQGFINGINSQKSKFDSTVRTIASTVSRFLHFSRPDEGPLRDYETWMPDMVEGLSRTLTNSLPILNSAVENVSDSIANNLKNASLDFSVDTNINKNINTNLSSDLENAVYSAIQKAENLFRLTINNELKLNTKTIAQEILDDINSEAKRRGYKPILQRG